MRGEEVARLIRELQGDRGLRAECPECKRTFALREAVLFPVRGPLPEAAESVITEYEQELRERKKSLRERRKRAQEAAGRSRVATQVGQLMEALVPVLEDRMLYREWRALGDPVDYVVFRGLVRCGRVEQVEFVEVKTGAGRTNPRQKMVQQAVEAGRVRFQVLPEGGRE